MSSRRCPRVSPNRPRLVALLGAAVVLVLSTLVASVAVAQDDPANVALQVEHFEPLPNQNHNLWNVLVSDTLGHLNWSAGSAFHYAEGLFLAEDPVTGEDVRLVDYVFKAEPWFAIGILDVAEVGIIVPVAFAQGGEDLAILNRPGEQVEDVGLGDIRLVLKARLLDPEDAYGIGVGFMAPISFPTGSEVTYNSEADLRFQPTLSVDYRLAGIGLVIAANAGLYLRETAQLLGYTRTSEFRWAFAVGAPLGVEGFQVVGDVFGAMGLEDNADKDDDSINSPVEVLGGIRYNAPFGLHASAGGGAGLSDGVGAPEWRVLGTLGYSYIVLDTDDDGIRDDSDRCVEQPEDLDQFEDEDGCPEVDNDQDGILDVEDGCPIEAEDPDGFLDEDGCPDLDNDEDGIPDQTDACPDVPEDPDGFADEDGCPEDNDEDGIADADDACPELAEDLDQFQDMDGCPEDDNDQDGILDGVDSCPMVAEDPDGFEDSDGCPDLDNDKDGLADINDQCPDAAEVINGIDDGDGCPDEGKTLVILQADRIEILEKVFFDTNKTSIKKQSFPLLDQVAAVLVNNSQIAKVRVEGHTDDVGADDANLKLSQGRAEAVVDYLVGKGVERDRLEAVGHGESKPLLEGTTKDARAANRRVEFTIVEQ